MMDEQRLREIEAQLRDAGISTHWVGCETTHTHCAIRVLITEVRRLQQANEDDTVLLGTVAGQRDAAMNAHADALGRIQDYILAADASAKERDAALAERDALKATTSREEDHWYAKWVDERAALTEARRVLREVEWRGHTDAHWCPWCGGKKNWGGHATNCILAAVFAQDTDA